MRLRPGALTGTWLAGSLAAGIVASIEGLAEGIRADGTLIGTIDSALGWLLITLPLSGLVIAFFFVPIAALLEYCGMRGALVFGLGGGVAGALSMAVFVWPGSYVQWAPLLIVPGIIAGHVWWLLAIRPDLASPIDPLGNENG